MENNLIEEESDLNQQEKPKRGLFELPRSTRVIIYIIFLLISVCTTMDGGAITISLVQFKEDLGFSDNDFALFTSIGSLSKIIASFVLIFLLNVGNRKILCIIFALFHIPSLLPIILCMSKYILFASKFLDIFIKNFFFIYITVWCDQFGVRKYKPLMISSLSFAMLLGSTLGKYLSLYVSWKFSMFVLMTVVSFFGVVFIFINSDYFARNIFSVDPKELEEIQHSFVVSVFREIDEDELIKKTQEGTEEEKNEIKEEIKQEEETQKNDENKQEEETPKNKENIPEEETTKNEENKEEIEVKSTKSKGSYIEDKSEIASTNIFKFPSFFLWVISLAVACIPQGILGTFLHEYLETALNITDKDKRFMMDTATNLITFIAGTSLGGILCTIVNGYDTIKARVMMVILYAILTAASSFLTTIDTLLNFFIIYGSMCLIASAYSPILTGIILTSVPVKIRGSAQSIQSLFVSIIGNLPNAYIYEFFRHYQKDDLRFGLRWSLRINYISAVIFIFALMTDIYKKKRLEKEQKLRISKVTPIIVDDTQNAL